MTAAHTLIAELTLDERPADTYRQTVTLRTYPDGDEVHLRESFGDGSAANVYIERAHFTNLIDFASKHGFRGSSHEALVAALETLRDYAREAAALNDADHIRGNSIKAHKMLMALAELSPRYDARIDRAYAALKAAKGGELNVETNTTVRT